MRSSLYTSLGTGYREALESGQAEVLGEDVVEGTPVYWIKIGPNNHDVAVSRETFEPVFIRVTQNGTTGLTRIVAYHTMPAGSAQLEVTTPQTLPSELGSYGAEVELTDAASLLGRPPVWAGPSLNGLAPSRLRSAPSESCGCRRPKVRSPVSACSTGRPRKARTRRSRRRRHPQTP